MRVGTHLRFRPSGALWVAFFLSSVASGATYTVVNTSDSGAGSLRQAITDANFHAGKDVIRFQIPGSGLHTITPVSALPTITDPVDIDGSTQPGSRPELDGSSAPFGSNGLHISAGGSSVGSLVINRFRAVLFGGGGGHGILIDGPGGNFVVTCLIGLNATATAKLPNQGAGVFIDSSSNNTIGGFILTPHPGPMPGNVISGNSVGVVISGGDSSGNAVKGNVIGSSGLGNAGDGVEVVGGSGNEISLNQLFDNGANGISVGGNAAAASIVGNRITGSKGDGVQITGVAGNTVSSNTIRSSGRNGILVFDGASNNHVASNLVGIQENDDPALGNAGNGIIVSGANDNVVTGNVVCGNGVNGIRVRSGASNNVVQGNFVGVTPSGTALGNGDDGSN